MSKRRKPTLSICILLILLLVSAALLVVIIIRETRAKETPAPPGSSSEVIEKSPEASFEVTTDSRPQDVSDTTDNPAATAAPDNTPTEEEDSEMQTEQPDRFYAEPINEYTFNRIYGKSYPEGCTLDLDTLRLLHVLHRDFNGEIAEGELIVNTAIADTVLDIFRELFEINYPIEKIVLIDEYGADDEASMEDNNSSAFNYRYIAETEVLSNHALGFAIDINTLYNPYVYTRKDGSLFLQPVNAGPYVDRDADSPYYIRHGDACYNIFTQHGFTWGGDWKTKKDYQHFEYKPAE